MRYARYGGKFMRRNKSWKLRVKQIGRYKTVTREQSREASISACEGHFSVWQANS
jgi:hypothetical protein